MADEPLFRPPPLPVDGQPEPAKTGNSRKRKRAIRTRMAETGENYTTACVFCRGLANNRTTRPSLRVIPGGAA